MKNKYMIHTFAVLLAVMLCMTALSTVAFASDGDAAPTSEAQTEPTGSAGITGDDLSELISALFGSMLGGTEKSGKTGTVTTNGGKLNVRTGAGLDNYAFTQLPNGTVVEVIGTDGDWYMIRLPEKIGYVYSGYMTLSDTGGENNSNFSFSMLNELIDHIEVHQAEKIDGIWEQHLVIHYNCVGVIFIPDVFPLPAPQVSVNTRKGVVVNYAPGQLAV